MLGIPIEELIGYIIIGFGFFVCSGIGVPIVDCISGLIATDEDRARTRIYP